MGDYFNYPLTNSKPQKNCFICEKPGESLKACKSCGIIHIGHSCCKECTEIEGNIIRRCCFMGRRFCHSCVIVITESEKACGKELTFKEFYDTQMKTMPKEKLQEKYKENQKQNVPDILDDDEERNPGLFGAMTNFLLAVPNYFPSPYYNQPPPREERNSNQGLILQNRNAIYQSFNDANEEYYEYPQYAENFSYPMGSQLNIKRESDEEYFQALEKSKISYEEDQERLKKEEEMLQKVLKESRIEHENFCKRNQNLHSNEKQKVPNQEKIQLNEEEKVSILQNENLIDLSVKSQDPNVILPSIKQKIVDPIRESVYPDLNRVDFHSENPEDNYKLIRQLATGGSGVIFICQKITTNEFFAAKLIDFKSEHEQDLIKNEVILTVNSIHPNIIKYYEYYRVNRKFWIIEELMSCSLADMILDMQGQIPEKIIAYVLKETLQGISFLHSQKRIHRDIKSDNILINQQGQVKIGDLGFAAQLERSKPNRSTFAGTLLWMPPEILSQQVYSLNIDIWSLGIVAYELAQGEPPHYHSGQQRIIGNIIESEAPRLLRPEIWSLEFNDFIAKCLVKDPVQRANSNELLIHPFITDCRTTNLEFQAFFNEWAENR